MLPFSKTKFISYLHVTLIILSVFIQQSYSSAQEQTEPRPESNAIVIVAVGDIMMPVSIQQAVARDKDNYPLLFKKIVPDLFSADITVANLETPVDHTSSVSDIQNLTPDQSCLLP